MEWMIMPLKRFAEFSGRSRRKEYWMFVLLQMLILIPVAILAILMGGPVEDPANPLGSTAILIVLGVYFLVFFIPASRCRSGGSMIRTSRAGSSFWASSPMSAA